MVDFLTIAKGFRITHCRFGCLTGLQRACALTRFFVEHLRLLLDQSQSGRNFIRRHAVPGSLLLSHVIWWSPVIYTRWHILTFTCCCMYLIGDLLGIGTQRFHQGWWLPSQFPSFRYFPIFFRYIIILVTYRMWRSYLADVAAA